MGKFEFLHLQFPIQSDVRRRDGNGQDHADRVPLQHETRLPALQQRVEDGRVENQDLW